MDENIKKNILVSVVVLTYNEVNYVKQTLESIMQQEVNFAFEIVVYDDASEDRTVEVIKEMSEKFPDIISVNVQNKNVGLIKNFRDSINKCKGEYIAFCAGDDYWSDKYKLKKQIDILEKNYSIGVVHSDCDILSDAGKIIQKSNKFNNKKIKNGRILNELIIENFVKAPTMCVRKSLIDKYVDLDDYIKRGYLMEDYPLLLDLANYCEFYYLDESLVTYRARKNSIRQYGNPSNNLLFYQNTYQVQIDFINKYKIEKEIFEKIRLNHYRGLLVYGFLLLNKEIINSAKNECEKGGINFKFHEIIYIKFYKNKICKITGIIILRIYWLMFSLIRKITSWISY